MQKPSLKTIFIGLQEQMRSRLSTNSGVLHHAPTKGDASELNWIAWLTEYLPKRYQVDKAFVIDSADNISDQLDLVIYDRQYSPFVFNQDGAKYIPAESVYAVFEVKQELNKVNLEYAGQKIKSVRQLIRTSAPIVHAGGHIQQPKAPFRILGGILTLSSGWVEPFAQPFSDCLTNYDEPSQVDLGCVLDKSSFAVTYLPLSTSPKPQPKKSRDF